MQKASEVLELLSTHHALTKQLRRGDLRAFEKLNLSFDELYASAAEKDEPLLDPSANGCDPCYSCILTDGGTLNGY